MKKIDGIKNTESLCIHKQLNYVVFINDKYTIKYDLMKTFDKLNLCDDFDRYRITVCTCTQIPELKRKDVVRILTHNTMQMLSTDEEKREVVEEGVYVLANILQKDVESGCREYEYIFNSDIWSR